MNYQNFIPLAGQKNKPNSNPIRQACVVCEGVAGLIKPNLRRARMNVNLTLTKDYRKKDDFSVRINKPNFQKAKMNVNLYIIEDYRKKDDFIVRINKPNSNPIFVKPKMSANLYVIEDYENETAFRPKKTNPIQTQY